MAQKDVLLNTMKESHKKMVAQVEDMKLPDLSAFLNDKYASIQNQQFVCDTCNLSFTNRRSLASHKKMHKNKSGSAGPDDDE
jgi:transposase-like protein